MNRYNNNNNSGNTDRSINRSSYINSPLYQQQQQQQKQKQQNQLQNDFFDSGSKNNINESIGNGKREYIRNSQRIIDMNSNYKSSIENDEDFIPPPPTTPYPGTINFMTEVNKTDHSGATNIKPKKEEKINNQSLPSSLSKDTTGFKELNSNIDPSEIQRLKSRIKYLEETNLNLQAVSCYQVYFFVFLSNTFNSLKWTYININFRLKENFLFKSLI